ncbi:MAG: hypothetical protein U0168_14165 [Nannocystaceae bacterium]
MSLARVLAASAARRGGNPLGRGEKRDAWGAVIGRRTRTAPAAKDESVHKSAARSCRFVLGSTLPLSAVVACDDKGDDGGGDERRRRR